MAHRSCLVLLVSALVVLTGRAYGEAPLPTAVSPGDPDRLVLVDSACPTLTWSGAVAVQGYEIVVFEAEQEDHRSPETASPWIRLDLPAGTSAWTPSLDRCLAPGTAYGWSVRAVRDAPRGRGPSPGSFEWPTSQISSTAICLAIP